MLFLLSLLSLFSPDNSLLPPSRKTSLTIDIQNVRLQKGMIYVALFKPDSGFPEGTPLDGKKADVKGSSVQTTFLIEPGEYAIAVFHDENSNGKMDKRFFGLPKEPYGFSNNVRPRLSAPKFKDCQFSVGSGETMISIKLE